MTRDEAIERLKKERMAQGFACCYDEVLLDAIDMAIKALEQMEVKDE